MNTVTLNHDPALYRELGYCHLGRLIDARHLHSARRSLDRQIASLEATRRPEALVEPHMLAEDWSFWLDLCATPSLLDAVQSCLACDELLLLMSHLIVKPALDGKAVAWHQDNTYWPSVHGHDVCTVWLALDDVDTENACMHVIPNSHQGFEEMEKIPTDGSDLLGVRVDVSAAQQSMAVPIELAAGEASVHDSFILHGSAPNRSSRRRAGYTMRYADAASVDVDVASHNKPVYYLRGDGTNLKKGYRDFRPACPLPTSSGAEDRSAGTFGK